jgi:hypothetical protein
MKEYKECNGTYDHLRLFKIHLNDCTTIRKITADEIRKETPFNIYSPERLYTEILKADYSGVDITDVLKEADDVYIYIVQLEQADKIFTLHDRLYATRPFRKIQGLKENYQLEQGGEKEKE